MELKTLTYTSLARLDLTEDDLLDIIRTARNLNAIDGITGLLVFNGTHFLQVIEGAEEAIAELVERLRRDPRHSGLQVRDERLIGERSFPDWSMELVKVKSNYFEARETIADRLPRAVVPEVRAQIFGMTEAISGTVRL